MALRGIEALANDPRIDLLCSINPDNIPFIEKLSSIGIGSVPTSRKLVQQMDKMLCIQGDIRQSIKGLKAARTAGVECVSYLALPHRMADMGAKLGSFRDHLSRRFVNMPDRFIAISDSMRNLLVERGCRKPITVVSNGIPLPAPPPSKPQFEHPVIGLFGRMEFTQKQQHLLIDAFRHEAVFNTARLLVVGDGPDARKLAAMVKGMKNIELLPWQRDMEALYNRIDLLAIPSRYEGVPLVMLEALARGIPVMGSARDGMEDILPKDWTFDPKNRRAIANAFSNVVETFSDHIDALRQRMHAEYSLEAFKVNFATTVKG